MMPYDAVLFDCDGVLLDSEPLGLQALIDTLEGYGHAFSLLQAAEIFSGNSKQQSFDWLGAQGLDAPEVFHAADQRLFAMFDRHIPLIEGIAQVLAAIELPIAVCSNALHDRLAASLRRSPLAAYFGPHIYSGQDVATAKPAPDLALYALEQLGLAGRKAIFVDDNVQGMLCAKAAGCLAIGFIGPSEHRRGHAETLFAAGADHVVHGSGELHRLLQTLTRAKAA